MPYAKPISVNVLAHKMLIKCWWNLHLKEGRGEVRVRVRMRVRMRVRVRVCFESFQTSRKRSFLIIRETFALKPMLLNEWCKEEEKQKDGEHWLAKNAFSFVTFLRPLSHYYSEFHGFGQA